MAGWLKKLLSPSPGRGQAPILDLPPLTDSDFEFLFDQLLQGTARGWQPDRLEVFMADLGVRGKVTAWEDWLERYSTKILTQAQPPQQHLVGTRLLFLSNTFRNSPKLERLAKAFATTGQQLVSGRGKIRAEIWEYDGADALAEAAPPDTRRETPAVAESPEPIATEPVAAPPSADVPTAETTSIDPAPAANTKDSPSLVVETPTPDEAQTLQTLFKEGLLKAEQGDFPGAIAAWDEVIRLKPTLAEVWHNRGSALGRLEQYEEALISLDQARQLAPDNLLVWRDRSYILMNLGQWEAALDSWNQTIALREDMAEAWYQRGLTLEQLHKPDNAAINYRRVLALVPEFDQAKERLMALEKNNIRPGTAPSLEAKDPWAD
jgi:tetratricopeptide (TPR) repeat protein